MRDKEQVLVVGSGIAGLGAALALGGGSREVTIVDRDPPPPDGSFEEAFYNWERKGATQLRHSHAFLGEKNPHAPGIGRPAPIIEFHRIQTPWHIP